MARKADSKNIDNMMMAFADLSASNTKGSSFKGPALKEVKVAKASAPSFQSSQKSRDWSCLDQSLEDAFISGGGPQQRQQQQQQGGQQTQQPAVLPFVPQPQLLQHQEQPRQPQDDWGDFTGFQSPTAENVQPSLMVQSNVNVGHGAFLAPVTGSSVMPSSQPGAPEDDDEFDDFVTARPTPASAPSATATTTTASVGSRLAAFQDESPVHRFKPVIIPNVPTKQIQPLPPTLPQQSKPKPEILMPPEIADDDEDDFGDFAATPNPNPIPILTKVLPKITAPKSFPTAAPIPSATSVIPPPSAPAPSSVLQPAPVANAGDKYSALRDFLGEDVTKDSYSSLPHEMPKIEGVIEAPGLQGVDEEDDFGDFIEPPTKSLPPMPASNLTSGQTSDSMKTFGNVFGSQTQSSMSSMPWHQDAPPPVDDDLGDHESKHSDILKDDPFFDSTGGETGSDSNPMSLGNLSLGGGAVDLTNLGGGSLQIPDDINNLNIPSSTTKSPQGSIASLNLGTAAPAVATIESEPSKPKEQPAPAPKIDFFAEIADISDDPIDVGPLESETKKDDNETEESNSKKDSPDSLPELAHDNVEEIVAKEADQGLEVPPRSPYREWFQVIRVVLNLINNAREVFDNLGTDKELHDEVLEDEETVNFVRNLTEIYRVFKRIQTSYSASTWNESIQRQCQDMERSWKAFCTSLKRHQYEIIPVKSHFDFSQCIVNNVDVDRYCGLCLLSLEATARETSDELNDAITDILDLDNQDNQRRYHAPCANLWLNLVNPDLPCLVKN